MEKNPPKKFARTVQRIANSIFRHLTLRKGRIIPMCLIAGWEICGNLFSATAPFTSVWALWTTMKSSGILVTPFWCHCLDDIFVVGTFFSKFLTSGEHKKKRELYYTICGNKFFQLICLLVGPRPKWSIRCWAFAQPTLHQDNTGSLGQESLSFSAHRMAVFPIVLEYRCR